MHVTTLNKQRYKTQVHSQSDVPEHTHPDPTATGVLFTDKRPDSALSGWIKERKTNEIKKDSQRSYSSLLSAPNGGWSVVQDSSAVLGESKTEIQYRPSRLSNNEYSCVCSGHQALKKDCLDYFKWGCMRYFLRVRSREGHQHRSWAMHCCGQGQQQMTNNISFSVCYT